MTANPYQSPKSQLEAIPSLTQFEGTFGSAFSVDQFRFVRSGSIVIEPTQVVLNGMRGWSQFAKFAVFLLITFVPLILFRFGLGFLLAAVIVHYLCASKGIAILDRKSIAKVSVKGHKVTFNAQEQSEGKSRKCVFIAESKIHAKQLGKVLALKIIA